MCLRHTDTLTYLSIVPEESRQTPSTLPQEVWLTGRPDHYVLLVLISLLKSVTTHISEPLWTHDLWPRRAQTDQASRGESATHRQHSKLYLCTGTLQQEKVQKSNISVQFFCESSEQCANFTPTIYHFFKTQMEDLGGRARRSRWGFRECDKVSALPPPPPRCIKFKFQGCE